MSPPRTFSSYKPRGPFRPPQTGPSISFFEQISLKDINEGHLNNKIVKIVETLKSALSDDGNYVALKLFANVYKKTPNENSVEEANARDTKAVVGELEEALKKHLENREKILAERPERLKKLRESKKEDAQELEPTLETQSNDSPKNDKSKKRTKSENADNSNIEEPKQHKKLKHSNGDDSMLEQPNEKRKKQKKNKLDVGLVEEIPKDDAGATIKSSQKKNKNK